MENNRAACRKFAMNDNDEARAIPSPPSGERVRVRGNGANRHITANTAPAPLPPASSPANSENNPPMQRNVSGACYAIVASMNSNSVGNTRPASTTSISTALSAGRKTFQPVAADPRRLKLNQQEIVSSSGSIAFTNWLRC